MREFTAGAMVAVGLSAMCAGGITAPFWVAAIINGTPVPFGLEWAPVALGAGFALESLGLRMISR